MICLLLFQSILSSKMDFFQMLTSYHFIGCHSFYVCIYISYIHTLIFAVDIIVNTHICSFWYRIQKDSVDPEKLQTTLRDGTFGETCDLNSTLEMVAILEAQLKEMNPNLDSTSEYAPANIYMQLKLVGLQFLLIY